MITVIGAGTGAPLDAAALDAVRTAGLVVGARRHIDAAGLPPGTARVVMGPLAPALDAVEEHLAKADGAAEGGGVVVLASGDPGFFGIARALAERFGPAELDIRPGVSSVATAFARIGLPWDDAVVVSAHGGSAHGCSAHGCSGHGRDLRTAVNTCRAHPKVAVLTGPGSGPAELGAELMRRTDSRTLVVASALGDPEQERVERVTPAEAAGRDWGTRVDVVLCLAEERAVAPVRTHAGSRLSPAQWALDEGEFTHSASVITTFEVRALALARLGPRLGDLVWDIGAGSGSVAVECARFGAAVVAVEKTLDGVERVRANAAAHGVDVRAVHGAAPTVLSDLSDPDAVFIGGGGRELPAIVTACARRSRRTVVVATAAIDRVPAVRAALSGAGYDCDGVLLQSSRLAQLPGEVSRLAAADPVFLLWGTRSSTSLPQGAVR